MQIKRLSSAPGTISNQPAKNNCCWPTMPESADSGPMTGRRKLLGMPIAFGTMAIVAGSLASEAASVSVARAQSTLSPKAALQALMDGNRRFVSAQLNSCSQDLRLIKQQTESKQEPFAAVLSCADSRVPVELVFDQSIGQIFVTRVAGNIATPEIIASLEYGVAVLGTRVIVVLGHGDCGAIKATIAGKQVPGQISALYQFMRPAVDQASNNPDKAIRANARIQATLLAQSSPVLAEAIKGGTLLIVPAYYDVATGGVTIM